MPDNTTLIHPNQVTPHINGFVAFTDLSNSLCAAALIAALHVATSGILPSYRCIPSVITVINKERPLAVAAIPGNTEYPQFERT